MFYLASASPRRRELLTQIGVQFELAVVNIDETPQANEPAQCYVERLALAKAQAALAHIKAPDAVMLGADTCVTLDGNILTKPQHQADACAMLHSLSGNCHRVLTAVALVSHTQQQLICVATDVSFRDLTDAEIDAYIATGEPMDKAGSYGIQGKGAILVDNIRGSYSNVVGLPLTETATLLKNFDIPFWT